MIMRAYPPSGSIKAALFALTAERALLVAGRGRANSICTNARRNLSLRISRQKLPCGLHLLSRVR